MFEAKYKIVRFHITISKKEKFKSFSSLLFLFISVQVQKQFFRLQYKHFLILPKVLLKETENLGEEAIHLLW